MAGEDDLDYGSARIRIELDDSGITAESRAIGQRIKRALDQSTRGIGAQIRRNIERGLSRPIDVEVTPNVARFETRLARALRGLSATVRVEPDLTRFQTRLEAALRGLGSSVSVPVVPDAEAFRRRLETALRGLDPVTVQATVDADRLAARVRRAARQITASVDVSPDLSRFQSRLEAGLRGQGSSISVRVTPDTAVFRTRLEAALRGLGEFAVQVTVDANRFERRVARALRNLSASVEIRPETSRFQVRLNRALRGITANVQVEPNVARFAARLRVQLRALDAVVVQARADAERFRRELERALRRLPPITIRVDPDLTRLNEALRRHNAPPVIVPVNPDTNRFTRAVSGLLGRLGGLAGTAAKALGGLLAFGAVGIAAANAAAGVGAFLSAIAPAAGIVAALPAALLTSVAAFGALKLALNGVGEAFKAALTEDAKKFEESLEDLSPAARAAAREVRDLKPALEDFRETVQDAFFTQFEGQITKVAEKLGGPLKSGLKSIASGFGEAAAEGLKFLQTQTALTDLEAILSGTSDAVGGLAGAVQPVLQGLLDIAAAVSKAFGKELGDSISSAGERFGEFLTGAAESGRAVTAVREAVTVFKQLGTLLGNIGGIIGGVFKAGEEASAGFLQNLITITGKVEEFVKSTEGQTALQNVFSTVGTIAAQLGPILNALITQVGAIAPELEAVFTAIGPAIVNLVNALGPALAAIAPSLGTVATALADGLAAIAPALGPLGTAIGASLEALAPLLPLVGAVAGAVGQLLAPALQILNEALAPVISELVDALLPVLPPLVAAFGQLLQALIPLGTLLGEALGELVAGLAPLLLTLAEAVGQVVVSLIPLVSALIDALMPVLPPLIEAFNAIVAALVPLLEPIAGLLASLGPLAATLVQLLGPLVQVGAEILKFAAIEILVPIIDGIVGALTVLINVLTTVINAVTAFVQAAIAGFQYLYNVLVGNSIIPDLVSAIISLFTGMPGRIIGAISGLVSSVAGVFRRAGSDALAAVRSFVGDAVSFLRGLPGKAASALSGAKDALVSAGRDLVNGMISGIKETAGNLVSAAKDVVGSAISAATDALKIGSPSKVFIEIGKETGRGFIIGLTGTAAQIRQTTERIAKSITDAFKGQNTRVDDALVALIQAGNKRLQALANQRDAIAKQIADAQKFATDTAASALQTGALQNLTRGDEDVTGRSIVSGLKNALFQIQKFNNQVNELAKRGLRKDLLQQIIGLGTEQGAALATALTQSSKTTLKQINSLQEDLAGASKKLGNDSADILFDAGKLAGQGFLEGLKGQQKAIEALMLRIAKGMQRAIRAALDIRSPSGVFKKIGDDTGAGLEIGFIDRVSALQKAAVTAADQVAAGVADAFAVLPALITQSLGNVNTKVLEQLKSGLPAAVRGILPFADGGIITRPTVGLLGEAGREVVLPLTRPQRARQLAAESGLLDILAGARQTPRGQEAAAPSVVHNWHITEVGDARATAHRVVARLAVAAGAL